jgi:hypothetical protein
VVISAVARRASIDAWLVATAAGAVVATFALRMGGRHSSLLDYDDGVYWQTGLAIAAGHRPYREVFFSQPPLAAWLLELPFRLGGGELAGRILMIGLAVLLAAAAGMLAWEIGDRPAGAVAALTLALLPPVQRYCFQFGADLPACAIAAWAVVCAARARTVTAGHRWWFSAGALLGAALLVKLTAVTVVPALLVIAAWGAGRTSRLLLLLAGAVASSALFLALFRPPAAASWRQVVSFHLEATQTAQPMSAGVISMLAAWIVPFSILAGAGAILTFRLAAPTVRPLVAALAGWGAAGALFAAVHRPIFEHHLLMFLVPGAALTASGLVLLLRRFGAPSLAALRGGVVVLAVVCIVQTSVTGILPRLDVENMLNCLRQLPAGAQILTDDQGLAARAGLRSPPWLVDTSRVRLASGHLTTAEIVANTSSITGVLLAPPGRARLVDPALRASLDARFPARFEADGYRLQTAHRADLARCGAPR